MNFTKRAALLILIGLVVGSFAIVSAAADKLEWTDVTKEIRDNTGSGKGWKPDPDAKVFKDATGNMLKVTSKLGNIRVDLKEKKVFHLTEKGEEEAKNVKLFKRNNFMVVIKSDKVKFRISLKEEVPGVVNHLEGLTSRN